MTAVKKIKELLSLLGVITLICLALIFPKQVSSGASRGLSLCAGVIIPSLFLFIFISDFTITSGVYKSFERAGFISRVLFRLPPCALPVIILGLTCGFPIGAKMTAQLYAAGEISENQAQRMLMFCVGAGAPFVISAVGCAMLGSLACGVIIFISLVLSPLIIGFITRFFDENPNNPRIKKTQYEINLSQAFVASASNAVQTMFSICTFVIIFTCLGSLIEIINPPEKAADFIKALSEVTTGCAAVCKKYPVPVTAGVLGWSGLCVHCQIMQYIKKCGMRLWAFWSGRAANAVISAVICQILIAIINPSVQTVSYARQMPEAISFLCMPATAGLIIMGAMLIFEVAKKDSLC